MSCVGNREKISGNKTRNLFFTHAIVNMPDVGQWEAGTKIGPKTSAESDQERFRRWSYQNSCRFLHPDSYAMLVGDVNSPLCGSGVIQCNMDKC